MRTYSKKLVVSRGRDGSIKIEPTSLYASSTVLRQLDAAVDFARKAGLIQPAMPVPAKKPQVA